MCLKRVPSESHSYHQLTKATGSQSLYSRPSELGSQDPAVRPATVRSQFGSVSADIDVILCIMLCLHMRDPRRLPSLKRRTISRLRLLIPIVLGSVLVMILASWPSFAGPSAASSEMQPASTSDMQPVYASDMGPALIPGDFVYFTCQHGSVSLTGSIVCHDQSDVSVAVCGSGDCTYTLRASMDSGYTFGSWTSSADSCLGTYPTCGNTSNANPSPYWGYGGSSRYSGTLTLNSCQICGCNSTWNSGYGVGFDPSGENLLESQVVITYNNCGVESGAITAWGDYQTVVTSGSSSYCSVWSCFFANAMICIVIKTGGGTVLYTGASQPWSSSPSIPGNCGTSPVPWFYGQCASGCPNYEFQTAQWDYPQSSVNVWFTSIAWYWTSPTGSSYYQSYLMTTSYNIWVPAL